MGQKEGKREGAVRNPSLGKRRAAEVRTRAGPGTQGPSPGLPGSSPPWVAKTGRLRAYRTTRRAAVARGVGMPEDKGPTRKLWLDPPPPRHCASKRWTPNMACLEGAGSGTGHWCLKSILIRAILESEQDGS